MQQVKRNKDKKDSPIGDSKVTESHCNELKMFQMFKNDDKSQSHSLVFKISKISPPPSSSTTTAFNEKKVFTSYFEADSIEKSEKDDTENRSNFQNKKENTSLHELCKSMKDSENQSDYLSFKILNTSETVTPTNFTAISFNEDKIFNSHRKVYSLKESENNYAEILSSLSQMTTPSLLMEKKESGVLESHKSLNNSKNQSHCPTFTPSETSEMKISTNPTVIQPYKDKTFPSPPEVNFVESLKDAEPASSSIVQPSEIKKAKTSIHVRHRNVNNDVNQSHSLRFKTSKIEASSSSIVIPINEDRAHYEVNSTKKTKSNDKNIANSSIQIPMFPTIKKENTNSHESRRSLNYGDNGNATDFIETSKESGTKTANYSDSTHLIPGIKKKDRIIEPRRSLRLLELQNKLNSSEDIAFRNLQPSNGNEKFCQKVKIESERKSAKKTNPNIEKQATKRKLSVSFASPPTEISHGLDFIHPSEMKLKSMILFPDSRESLTSSTNDTCDSIYPKFANVDPSQVLSSLTQQENIVKSLESGKTISLFFPDGSTSQAMRSEQNIFPPNEKLTAQYKFKKANFSLLRLSKKYPMMDRFTLDKCYGMSNCSVRKTEILLLDIIAGKEVFSTENSGFNCSSTSSTLSVDKYVKIPHSYSNWFPLPYCRSLCKEYFNQRCYRAKDSLSREIILQSLEILHDEEAVL